MYGELHKHYLKLQERVTYHHKSLNKLKYPLRFTHFLLLWLDDNSCGPGPKTFIAKTLYQPSLALDETLVTPTLHI